MNLDQTFLKIVQERVLQMFLSQSTILNDLIKPLFVRINSTKKERKGRLLTYQFLCKHANHSDCHLESLERVIEGNHIYW